MVDANGPKEISEPPPTVENNPNDEDLARINNNPDLLNQYLVREKVVDTIRSFFKDQASVRSSPRFGSRSFNRT